MHTLIVYNNNPEEARFYLIPNEVISERQRALLVLAHNVMVNADSSNEGTNFVCNALSSAKEYCLDDAPEEDKCIWAVYRYDFEGPIAAEIDHVYYTGCYL